MYCRVVPFSKTFDLVGLTYFVPEHIGASLEKYQIVSIPLKNTIEIGVVLDIYNQPPEEIPSERIKSLVGIHNSEIFLHTYQAKLIDYISYTYITPIHHALGLFFPKNLREKIQKETFQKVQAQEYSYIQTDTRLLSPIQKKAYTEISQSLSNKILLYGVTGSGKTEIYRKIIAQNLHQEKQTLLLIPEIILGNQIGERIQEMFGEEVLILSSNTTEAKRTQYWIDIKSGNAKIVIGTRSSLFYPYLNLGTIIVDEEHDQSYISDSAPRYNTTELVEYISTLLDIPVIFASGTPSISRMYKAVKGEYQIVQLLAKYTNGE